MLNISHRHCVDGMLAAMVVKKQFPDIVTYFTSNWKELPPRDLWENQDVIITDFSYTRELMRELSNGAKSVLVLDHHKTAEDTIGDLDYVHIDKTRSGCQITWDWFNKGTPYPELIKHAGEADLGKYDLPDTAPIMDYCWQFPFEMDVWEKALNDIQEDKASIVKQGQVINAWKKGTISAACRNAFETELNGEIVWAINSSLFKNEFAYELCKKGKFAIVYSGSEGKWYWSLRSIDYNVEKIAKKFGGGGHKFAAAFTTDFAPSKFKRNED